jgi:hypothetical protein
MAGWRDPAATFCTRTFSVPIESERRFCFFFDAFSSREPVPTSLENALGCGPYLLRASYRSELPSQEIVMPSSGKWRRISRVALAFASTATVLLTAHAALASQGPGGGPGTASSFTQLAMGIIVYGTSALVLGSGLIGALRKH